MNFGNLIFKGFVFLCFFALMLPVSRSQDVAARVLKLQGAVQISRPDGSGKLNAIDLGAGAAVFTGDIIRTGSSGSLTLKLADNSQAMISENTTVEIRDITSSPRTIFNVLKGKTRIKIEKLGGRPNPYRVTTPTTVIAVRGTIFDVFVKGNKTDVYVNEGEVSVTSIQLSQEVILRPGNFTRVEGERPPRPPAVFTPQQNDKFFQPRDNPDQGRGDQGNPNDRNSDDKGNPRDRAPGNPPNQPSSQPPNNPGIPNQGGGSGAGAPRKPNE